jgi:hypothetical protein
MGDHSRANASAPIGQNPEHGSIQGDQNHHPEALVRVSRAECCGRKENAGGSALSQGHELPLQVTSKDCLRANTGGNGERYPKCQFDTSLGSMDTLRLRAAVRRSQPNIQRSIAATIQKPTAIPISRSTWRTERQCSPKTMRTEAPLPLPRCDFAKIR